jgi:superfamily I DNA/RNA helicase
MNPFQRARDEAIEARKKILGIRANGNAVAADLLKGIEANLKIAIESVDPAYYALGGASAVLQRDERFIYVSKEVEEDKFAALVAHELGHWFLDADKSQSKLANLDCIAGSAGSPAVVIVEAYGARERQELQANVFARELLLPRDIAKRLYAAGRGPARIAHDLGIPLEFARQQLLDALLLPESNFVSSKALHDPSDDQRAAAEASERFANVVAGPGTGKTSTLIHRVKYLIESRQVDPAHILVLTFTNKAAFELVERLRQAGIARAADIWAGTFHAFGLEFLRKFHQRFNLEPDLIVADTMNSMSALAAALPGVSLQHYSRVQDPYDWLHPIVHAITRLKEELVSPKQYRSRVAALSAGSDAIRRRREDLATLYELHELLLAKLKRVDFVDLVSRPAVAIQADRAAYSELADKFQYILVDEYQDVTLAMIELMRQLALKAKSLWVVGDVRQAIHHWRGASVHSLIRFDKTFKVESGNAMIQRYPLKKNRRSSREVLDLVEQVGRIHVLETSLPLDHMVSVLGKTGIMPGVVTANLRSSLPAAVYSAIEACKAADVDYRDQTVLCRAGADRELVSKHLTDSGVPVLFIGELAHRSEVKRLLCLMQLLVERHPKALIGLLEAPSVAMPVADINVLLQAAGKDVRLQRGRWLDEQPPGLSVSGVVVAQRLRQILSGHSKFSNPWDFVCDLLLEQRFEMPAPDDASIASWMSRIALWQFAYAVRNGEGDPKQARLPRFLLRHRLRQRVGENYGERELPPEAAVLDAVRVQTIHGSKGLEYDAVHIFRVTDGFFGQNKPSWFDPDSILELIPPEVLGSTTTDFEFEQSVERNNLLYVAVSRAKRHLWLYQDDEFGTNDFAPQLRHRPSIFKEFVFQNPDLSGKAAVSSPSNSVKAAPLEFERFETFARCPLQYAYRYEHQLRREDDADPSIRAQWAIMNALRAVASGGGDPPLNYLQAAWEGQSLPTSALDPMLWADALAVFDRGNKLIESFKKAGGNYAEPSTTVANLQLVLPWGFVVPEKYSSTFHLVRLVANGMAQTATLLRPMLQGLTGQGSRNVTLHSLLPPTEKAVQPSKAPHKTDGFRAAVRYQEGNREANRGRACARCAYLTICPQTPGAKKV